MSKTSTLFLAVLVTLLHACGGGGGSGDDLISGATSLPAGTSFTPGTQGAPLATVVSLTQVSKATVGDATEYVFKVSVKAGSRALRPVEAELTTTGPGTSIVDGLVRIDQIAANEQVSAADTITLRQGGTSALDTNALVWRVRGSLQQPPVGTGALLLTESLGRVAIGETLTATIKLTPRDERNPPTSLSALNETPGGASAALAADGKITWAPNAADFNTSALKIVARYGDGSTSTHSITVTVTKARLVAQIALSGPSRYGDESGRYVIQVDGSASAATGTLVIAERYDATGAFTPVVSVPDATLRVKFVREPLAVPQSAQSTPGALAKPTIQAALVSPFTHSTSIVGQKIDTDSNLFTVRQDVFHWVKGVIYDTTTLLPRFVAFGAIAQKYPAWEVARIEATCDYRRRGDCGVPVSDGKHLSPVMLVHGFTPELSGLGGGIDTWGSLAARLKSAGHPVIELRWMTGMRFEEAAGLLARLSAEIASNTGHKPFVIAHSFGGVVAHLALAGKGIAWNPAREAWDAVDAGSRDDPLFAALVTLASPLSGINDDPVQSPKLVRGRYDLDRTINTCQSVTCVQAGAFDVGTLESLQRNAALLRRTDGVRPASGSAEDLDVGESIRSIRAAWEPGGAIAIAADRVHTVVAVRERPIDDFTPDIEEATAFQLGDGLISLVGQAVLARDFLCTSAIAPPELYVVQACLNQQGVANFFEWLDKAPVPGEKDWLRKATLRDGRKYYFATRAAHTSWQADWLAMRLPTDRFETQPFPIAWYPETGNVIVGEDWWGRPYEAAHPLQYFIDNVLKSTDPATQPPAPALVTGRVVVAGQAIPVSQLFVGRTIVRQDTGVPVRPTSWVALDATGAFSFDAGAWIRAEMGPSAALSDYRVRISIADPKGTKIYDASFDTPRLSGDTAAVDLGVLTVYPVATTTFVTLSGVVRDSASGLGVADAFVWVARGANMTAGEVMATPPSRAARRVQTDYYGNFRIDGLLPGDFTLQASGGLMAGSIARLSLAGSASIEVVVTQTATRYPGSNSACFPTTTGGLKCWGGNEEGQIGDGSLITRLSPVSVAGLSSGVAHWSVGDRHACAAKTDQSLWCWGWNADGQLGDGTYSRRTSPVRVQGIAYGIVQVAAGAHHTCALTSRGGVLCWGGNWFGQLGDGSTVSRTTPAPVSGLGQGVVSISSGWWFTCALTSAGSVFCWGDNIYGQLGNGGVTSSLVPGQVLGLGSGVTGIYSGGWHQCAVWRSASVAGNAYCWGWNGSGELGDGSTNHRSDPRLALSNVAAMAAGDHHTCALLTGGGVACWGRNDRGQVGDNSWADRLTAYWVTGLQSGVQAISGRGGQTTVRMTNGTHRGWGQNDSGQVGDGTQIDRGAPVSIFGLGP